MKQSYAVKELQAFRRYAYHKHKKERIRAFLWKMLKKHYHNKVASDYE